MRKQRQSRRNWSHDIHFAGADDSFIYWCLPSWTRKGVEHDVVLYKDTAWFYCTCEDCQCRRKGVYLESVQVGGGCKHIRAVWERFLELCAVDGQLPLII